MGQSGQVKHRMKITSIVTGLSLATIGTAAQRCYTTQESNNPNVACVFPFIYQGTTYYECTRDSDPEGKRWCATKVDEEGFYIENSGQYGYCSQQCFEKSTEIDTRTIGDQISETDRQCNNDEICKNQNKCQSFLEQKEQLSRSPRGSLERRRILEKLKKSVCNKSERGVCCSEKKNDKCKGGEPCLTENQCPYAQDLRRRFRNGDSSARRELVSLICDKQDRTFCCPSQQSDDSSSPSWLPSDGDCGRPGRPGFIVGGEDTRPGEFPFTALIGYTHTVKNKWVQHEWRFKTWNETKYKCGGTLINHWYVLTAAHCISKKPISVRLGEWEVLKDPDCEGEYCIDKVQDIDVASTIKHEAYEKGLKNIVNDIALIKLSRPAVLNNGVQIVCLPGDPAQAARVLGLRNLGSDLVGKKLTVVGWGYTEYDPYKKEVQGDFDRANVANTAQQKLEIPVLSSSDCTQKFGKLIPEDSQICAGGDYGKDSCKGDSGGPLYYSQKTAGRNTWYLLGLVSFGSKDCGTGKPGVYSRIESFMPWIRSNLE